MNYRHGYHAGNHTEVFKHSVLIALIENFKNKAKPFMVLDTHAGTGLYDLHSEKALKTGEANEGIRRVINGIESELQPYLQLIRTVGTYEVTRYPGSPELVSRILRDQDRLIACELHTKDAAALRANFSHDKRVRIHHRDGYAAIRAFVPPSERRGLVFIDPPFERFDEASRLSEALVEGIHRWPTGVFAGWFPIKDLRIETEIATTIAARDVKQVLIVKFLRFPIDGYRLAGSGLFIYNPPWKFDEKLEALCAALASAFRGGNWSIKWLA